jgi:hypothetical protein
MTQQGKKLYMRIVTAWDAATAVNADVLARDYESHIECSIRDPDRCPACVAAFNACGRIFHAVLQDVPGIDVWDIKRALEWREQETGEPVGFLLPTH